MYLTLFFKEFIDKYDEEDWTNGGEDRLNKLVYEELPWGMLNTGITVSSDLIPIFISESLDNIKKYGNISDPNLTDYLVHITVAIRLAFVCGLATIVKRALNLSQLDLSPFLGKSNECNLTFTVAKGVTKHIRIDDQCVDKAAKITPTIYDSLYYSSDIGPLLNASLDGLTLHASINWNKAQRRPAEELVHCLPDYSWLYKNLNDIYKVFCKEINDQQKYPNGFLEMIE